MVLLLILLYNILIVDKKQGHSETFWREYAENLMWVWGLEGSGGLNGKKNTVGAAKRAIMLSQGRGCMLQYMLGSICARTRYCKLSWKSWNISICRYATLETTRYWIFTQSINGVHLFKFTYYSKTRSIPVGENCRVGIGYKPLHTTTMARKQVFLNAILKSKFCQLYELTS